MHHCHATGCKKEVPPEMFICRTHWYSLPKALRDRIWRYYREGQCDDWNPSRRYCEAAKECVVFLAGKEGIEPDTKLYDMYLNDPDCK